MCEMCAKILIYFMVLSLIDGRFTTYAAIGPIRGCPTVSGVICIDQNTFGLCDSDGHLTKTIFNCAIESVCTEKSTEICTPLYKTDPPECNNNCGKCSPKQRFACVGRNKFALCRNGKYPGGMIYSCPENTVCTTSKFNSKKVAGHDLTEFCWDELLVPSPDCC